uniref:Myb-like DNA-binding protein n=1 Tax=Solanum tuberosum TaxID=4113 RepID=M1BQR0_SOLTU
MLSTPSQGPTPLASRWSDISDVLQIGNSREKFDGDCGTTAHPLLRRPFAVLAQNLHNAGESLVSHQTTTENASDNKTQGTFLKQDDPKKQAFDATSRTAKLTSNESRYRKYRSKP